MQTFFLVALSLVAGSPMVHADMNGGYVKSMFKGRQPVPTSSEFMDSRFFSLWSSFHKIYLEHLATATVSSSVATTVPAATTSGELNEPVFTIDTESPVPTVFSASGPTETVSLSMTVTESVSSCSSGCPSVTAPPALPETTSSAVETSAVQPSKNGTVTTSSAREESTTSSTSSKGSLRPSKTPPPLNGPLNGVSTNAAPVVGAVVFAIAGCLVML